MLTIRLQRVGKTKFPTYRIVISEKGRDTQDDCLENLGNFNPHVKENGLTVKADRVKYWVEKGAQMSNTINNLFVANNIISGEKKKSVYLSTARKKKIADKKGASAPQAVAPASASGSGEAQPAAVPAVSEAQPAPEAETKTV